MYFVGVGEGDLDTTESSRWCTLEVHTASLARERERVVNSLRLLNAFGTCCGCLCAVVCVHWCPQPSRYRAQHRTTKYKTPADYIYNHITKGWGKHGPSSAKVLGYFIFDSVNITCFLTTGSYWMNSKITDNLL
jgi:hypothetical protein